MTALRRAASVPLKAALPGRKFSLHPKMLPSFRRRLVSFLLKGLLASPPDLRQYDQADHQRRGDKQRS